MAKPVSTPTKKPAAKPPAKAAAAKGGKPKAQAPAAKPKELGGEHLEKLQITEVDVDFIHQDPSNIRKTTSQPEEDEALQESMRAQGLVHPIVLRPMPSNPGRYMIVVGSRRYRAAQHIGWPTISAVVRDMTDAQARKIQAVENAQRAPMHPIDVWESMVSLQREGVPLLLAGQCLGLTERKARQLDLLGKMEPTVLDLIRQKGVPPEIILASIARASPADQAAAVKSVLKKARAEGFYWNLMQSALSTKAIPMERAIFKIDGSGVVFQQDPFAQPGSPDEWTTSDVTGFLTAQENALKEKVAGQLRRGDRVEYVAWDTRHCGPVVPDGYDISYMPAPKSLKLGADSPILMVYAVDRSNAIGRVSSQLCMLRDVPKNRKKGFDEGRRLPSDAGSTRTEASAPEAEETGKRRLTQAAQTLISVRKTAAIRGALDQGAALVDMPPLRLLQFALITFCAYNVKVSTTKHGSVSIHHKLLSYLVNDDGSLKDIADDAADLVALLLETVIICNDPISDMGSGRVAEIVGHALSAERYLSGFTSPELLATYSLEVLQQAGEAEQLVGAAGVKILRGRLAEKTESKWFPPEAAFLPAKGALKEPFAHDANDDGPGEEDDSEAEE